MRLHTMNYPELYSEWFQANAILRTIPMITDIFRTDENIIFLENLLAFNMSVAHGNSFETEILPGLWKCYLFPILSYFNHSCSPNVANIIQGNTMYCIACRELADGEQLFIDYVGFNEEISTAERQAILKKNWGFDCRCVRCSNNIEIETAQIRNATRMVRTNALLNTFLQNTLEVDGARGEAWTTQLGADIIAYRLKIEEFASNTAKLL